jgi:hypothetical protein
MFIAPIFLMYPAPSGAACKRNAPKGYKHGAPTEHFAAQDDQAKTTFCAKPTNTKEITNEH